MTETHSLMTLETNIEIKSLALADPGSLWDSGQNPSFPSAVPGLQPHCPIRVIPDGQSA
jgi:hypothetical protein